MNIYTLKKSSQKILFITGFLSLFTFSGCFDGGSDEAVTEAETDSNYSISIPETWEVFPKKEYEKNMIFAAREAEYSSNFPIILTISSIHSLPSSLNTLINKNYEVIRKESQDFKIISEEDFTVQEIERSTDSNEGEEESKITNSISNPNETRTPAARLVTYTENYTGTNSFALVYSLNVLSYKEQKTYVINILTDLNASDEEKDLIMQILKSFTITL